MKKVLGFLVLATMLMVGNFVKPMEVHADTTVNYLNETGNLITQTGVVSITSTSKSLSNGWYVVDNDVTVNDTMTVTGDVKLILVDGKTLTVTGSKGGAGINVAASNNLTIYGQTNGTGKINAKPGPKDDGKKPPESAWGSTGAAIGGNALQSSGTISINGGVIIADASELTGANVGAGIGGGSNSSNGTINISRGHITATGGIMSSGIGGGKGASGGNITISGGTVVANGSANGGAGIGGGLGGTAGDIKISGGDITAIGHGWFDNGIGNSTGSVNITGGTITASNGGYDNINGINGSEGQVFIGDGVTLKYTIRFLIEWDATPKPLDIVATGGAPITAPTVNPTRSGYTFMGWDPELPETMPNKNVNIGAKWVGLPYTATFDSKGGTSVSPIIQECGTSINFPTDPTKEGYRFNYWNPFETTMPVGGIAFHAVWDINKYTVSFDSKGGSAVGSITEDYNSVITAPTNPTRLGYDFGGWDPTIPATMPSNNVVVSAKWTGKPYTITFDTAGGSPIGSITQNAGTVLTAPANPVRPGFAFFGWDDAFPTTMPVGGMTLTASWVVLADLDEDYTITFDTGGGSVVGSITAEFGTAITSPENPVRMGYTFTGWDTAVPTVMPATNMTIRALWTINSYTITFDPNNGEEVTVLTANFNSPITAPANPTRAGYKFNGWGTGVPATMPAGNMTIVANWKSKLNVTQDKVIDETSDVFVEDIEGHILLPELLDEQIEEVALLVTAKKVALRADIRDKVEAQLAELGYVLLDDYDIHLYKRVKAVVGTLVETEILEEEIIDYLHVDIPLTDEQASKKELDTAYIDEDGNVEIILAEVETVDGKKYLGFNTNHFSEYAVVEKIVEKDVIITTDKDAIGKLPNTSIDNNYLDYLLLTLSCAAVLVVLRKKSLNN